MFTLQRGKGKSHRECLYLNYMVVFVPESYYLAMKINGLSPERHGGTLNESQFEKAS